MISLDFRIKALPAFTSRQGIIISKRCKCMFDAFFTKFMSGSPLPCDIAEEWNQ